METKDTKEVFETFEVEMRMFQEGAIRSVIVPKEELMKEVKEDALLSATQMWNLGRIWYYGQNDIHPSEKYCSVSAGDIIRYRGDRWLILMSGFKKLDPGELTEPLTTSKEIAEEAIRMLTAK